MVSRVFPDFDIIKLTFLDFDLKIFVDCKLLKK